MTRITCIYRIRNRINGKVYIGQTVDFEARKRNHLWKLKYGKHYNKELQVDFDTGGLMSMSFEIIEKTNILQLDRKEEDWLAHYSKYGHTYNIVKTMGAE